MEIAKMTDLSLTDFFKNKTKELTLTLFTEETYKQNQEYRKNHNIKCIYSCYDPISKSFENKGIYVLEGDITVNQIRGIGFIRLNKDSGNYRTIYEKKNYNNYTYKGNYHINREDMNEREEIIMQVFDTLCFYGKTHLKRFSGIKRFPKRWIYNMRELTDVLEFITKMFESRFRSV